jgi:hypothetical protein
MREQPDNYNMRGFLQNSSTEPSKPPLLCKAKKSQGKCCGLKHIEETWQPNAMHNI